MIIFLSRGCVWGGEGDEGREWKKILKEEKFPTKTKQNKTKQNKTKQNKKNGKQRIEKTRSRWIRKKQKQSQNSDNWR